jgi:Tol biopolymer transport system component
MALTPGTRFGACEITGTLGKGGMGEVYRGRDAKLERDVAIKVLPESFTSDASRVARFEQEAKTLAALNHANIAQVYGLEQTDGQSAIVMELVEGPTLADRIEQGPVPADEALGIAMQIAEALEAAHERGIVHRDLKPANIKLRPDGAIKVLDFGIAKAVSPELDQSGASPIMTTPATQLGVILGTAAYMSPEQARGKPVDQRTDIWAFGCVLYEMLTGQLAFGGEDVAVTLARVIANDTDLDSLPASISPAVQRTIELCLRKDPRKRVADIRDVKLALAGEFETLGHAAAVGAGAGSAGSGPRPVWQRPIAVAATALIAGAAIATVAAISLQPEPAPRPPNRFLYQLPANTQLHREGENVLAVSPDGRRFVINTEDGLYLREMDTLEGRLIPGTAEDRATPFFSPDGQSIGYWTSPGRIKRIGIGGGAAVTIATAESGAPHGAWWADDGTIFVTEDAGIRRVPANGGTPELIVPANGGEAFNGVQLLPDGDTLLFSVAIANDWDGASIVIQSISSGERTVLLEGGSTALYVATGHLVYALGTDLFAVAFDAATLTVSGGVVPLVQGVSRAFMTITGLGNYGIAANGTLVYLSGDARAAASLRLEQLWVDGDGREEPLGSEPCTCISATPSPDGTRIAFENFAFGLADGDIWIWSIEQQTFTRLTFEPGFDEGPVWSPDSTRIAYGGARGLFIRRADGTGAAEQVLDVSATPYSWSATGEIVYQYSDDAGTSAIGSVSLDGDRSPRPLIATSFDERRPALSPDGRWLAYGSDESGELQVYVRPFPDVDAGRWQVSTSGGRTPQWSADSSRLFFIDEDDRVAMVTDIRPGESFAFSTPRQFIDVGLYPSLGSRTRDYGVALDGERLLLPKLLGASGISQLSTGEFVIVENWTEELKRLVPVE